jgi:hypothetical protein
MISTNAQAVAQMKKDTFLDGAHMQKKLDSVASQREMQGLGHELSAKEPEAEDAAPAPEGMGAPFGLAM